MATILVLEDDELLARQIAAALSHDGHKVVSFGELDEALAYFDANPVDLVIADIFIRKDGELTANGGITLIAQIRQFRRRRTPIIAISGAFSNASGHLHVGSAKVVGATETIAKPFHPDDLTECVERMLAMRRTA